MMPKGKNALSLLFIFLVSGGLMMGSAPRTSPAATAFNDSLRKGTGKSTAPYADALARVVIDAGHGGKDPGGMGANSMEKEIALGIARLFAIGIRTNYPDVEVIMTRSDDTFVPLYERAAIANKAGADLFVSIHANIMPGSQATYGTETFVMGQHVAEYNLDVAKRENAAIQLESGDVTANYGYDPNSPAGHILMNMQQHAFLERSIQFAEAVERQFAGAGRKSRGVKQAGFVVLKATTMPAVLVETGFMSNRNEEAFLLSEAGQQQLATALLKAFGEYYTGVTGSGPAPTAAPAVASPRVTPLPPAAAGPVRKEVPANNASQWNPRGVPVPVPGAAPLPQPAAPAAPTTYRSASPAPGNATVLRKEVVPTQRQGAVNRVTPGTQPTVRPVSVPILVFDYPRVDVDSTSPTGYRFREARQRKTPVREDRIDLRSVTDRELLYAVQVFATKNELDLNRPPFNAVPYPIVKVREGQYNKYQVRNLPTAAAARTAKQRIKAAGVRESMVVVYYRGERLPLGAVNYLLAR